MLVCAGQLNQVIKSRPCCKLWLKNALAFSVLQLRNIWTWISDWIGMNTCWTLYKESKTPYIRNKSWCYIPEFTTVVSAPWATRNVFISLFGNNTTNTVKRKSKMHDKQSFCVHCKTSIMLIQTWPNKTSCDIFTCLVKFLPSSWKPRTAVTVDLLKSLQRRSLWAFLGFSLKIEFNPNA